MTITTIFTDGGCKEGFGGWGMFVDSPDGPVSAAGGLLSTTNNRAELTAVIKAIEYIHKNKLSGVSIRSDSQYVIKGLTKYIKGWIANNWLTVNGDSVKNKDLWVQLYDLSSRAKESGFRHSISYVQAHAGIVGNEKADTLATRGIHLAQTGQTDYWSTAPSESPEKKPKFKKEERHPLLFTKNTLFVTGHRDAEQAFAEEFGYTHMHMMAEYKDDKDLNGAYLSKPNADAMFGILLTNTNSVIMGHVRDAQERYGDPHYNVVCETLMTPIFSKEVLEEVHSSTEQCLTEKDNMVSVWGRQELTRYLMPALRSSFAINELERDMYLLRTFIAKPDSFDLVVDITDTLYIRGEKGLSINDDVVNTKDAIPINIEVSGVPIKHLITPKVDLPPRNNLQKILKTEKDATVSLVIHDAEHNCYKFFIVIKTPESIALYAPYSSALRLIPQRKKK